MESYIRPVEIRWSDLDPNFHVRHSAYYDYGANCRVTFLDACGITATVMRQHNIGPILLREEALFRKEIRSGASLTINLQLTSIKQDMSRWSMKHELFLAGDVLAAVINIDAAWLDTSLRRIVAPPLSFRQALLQTPAPAGFVFPPVEA